MMNLFWQSGDHIALRGIFNKKVWTAVAVTVVKDTADETILLQIPGSQCMLPEGLFRRKKGDYSLGSRWEEAKNNSWSFQESVWHTNRFLIFLEPLKYYSIYYIWNHLNNSFNGYYVNFQIPYNHSHCGIDTLDLDLDIVIDQDFHWAWKDKDAYHAGIKENGIQQEWVDGVESSFQEVFERIQRKKYPLDGSWLSWKPYPEWIAPKLIKDWDQYRI